MPTGAIRYGAELTMKNQILKGWDLTSNVNFYQQI